MRLFLMIFSRTDLRIGGSRAKNCKESDWKVHFCLAPPKPAKKIEKQKFLTEKNCENKIFDVKKLNVGNRLKCVLAKFGGRTSFVWGVNGRSKFDVVAEKINFNLVSYYRRYCYYRRYNFFRRRNIKRWESSETRFGKVWRPYELCLMGKRPFEVWRRRRKH